MMFGGKPRETGAFLLTTEMNGWKKFEVVFGVRVGFELWIDQIRPP
jgi:hypothetical protein